MKGNGVFAGFPELSPAYYCGKNQSDGDQGLILQGDSLGYFVTLSGPFKFVNPFPSVFSSFCGSIWEIFGS